MRVIVVLTILFSFDALAYPIILKIKNTRDNTLFLHSEIDKTTIKIGAGETLEVLVLREQDWQVQYATGALGCAKWTFDEPLHSIIEGCKSRAAKGAFLVCDLEFRILKRGYIENNYVLEIIHARGGSEAIKVQAASIVLSLYFGQVHGLVTEHHRPKLPDEVVEPSKHLAKEFLTAIARVPKRVFETTREMAWTLRGLQDSYTEERVSELKEDEKPLVEYSTILQALEALTQEAPEAQVEELVTPGSLVSPGILGYLASLIGK